MRQEMDHARVLDDVCGWALDDENVRLVVVTGSLARDEDPADELSDLDVELYVREPQLLLSHRDWYLRFGQVLVVEELENPGWHPTRLIYYVDGKIDFMIAAVDAAEQGIGYTRPYRIIVDKDDLGRYLRETPDPIAPPTAAEADLCVNHFYAAAMMWTKAIVRDEPWAAKVREWEANSQLLQIIEWDHRSRYGWDYQTWYLGVHMRRWMDRDIQDALTACWADLSTDRMISAVSASVSLFDDLMVRTRDALGLEPFDSSLVRAELARLLHFARNRG
jgi:aminoglycoside 6-adenylyltransferase